MLTIRDLERHALGLAEKLKIKVRYWNGNRQARAQAFVKSRTIDIERIVCEVTYCVALHEIGHIQTDATARRLGKDFIVGDALYNSSGESRAWTWAREHALIWTPSMQQELRRALRCVVAYATKGLADPIWRELDQINGRLTVGYAAHAHAQLERSIFADCQRLARQWRAESMAGQLTIDEARKRL